MGRRRKGRTVEVKALIPEEIYFRFERRLTNDFANKPEYGLRSQLITQLIVKWLDDEVDPAETAAVTEKEHLP